MAVSLASAGLTRAAGAEALETFRADLAALTAAPHRLAGSDQGRAAIDHLEQRLRGLGIQTVLPLDFPVWHLPGAGNSATLEINGRVIPLLPMRPNLVAPPITPEQGLAGPLRYLGRGEAEDFAGRDLRGALVVLDYDAPTDAWHRAFEAGAAAVLFRGAGPETTPQVKHAAVPINLPRFYLPVDPRTGQSAGVDVTQDQPSATLRASGRWQRGTGRNLLAVLPGRPAKAGGPGDLRGEVVVIAAAADSFGTVPHRSPGARHAANAALLLRAAQRWAVQRPARTVVLLFVDAEAQGHLGARHVYDALGMRDAQHERLRNDHLGQRVQWRVWRDTLDAAEQQGWGVALPDPLQRLLARHADWARADAARDLRLLRLRLPRGMDAWDDDGRAAVRGLRAEVARWDTLRRVLHEGGRLADARADALPLDRLLRDVRGRIADRLDELDEVLAMDLQRDALRGAVSVPNGDLPATVKLHVTLDLAGDGPTWGLYVGDHSGDVATAASGSPEADAPGYYQAVLAHFNTALGAAVAAAESKGSPAGGPLLETATLRDAEAGRRLVPGTFVNSGYVAGTYGVFNVALMTCHDARPRDGHPADTADRLDAEAFVAQGGEALALLDAVLDRAGLPARPAFKPRAVSQYVTGTAENPHGPAAQQRVAGGLSEDRPARGAMVAAWSTKAGDAGKHEAWEILGGGAINAYEPARLAPIDAQGRFAIIGAHGDYDANLVTLGVKTDARGEVSAVSNWATLSTGLRSAIRTDLVTAGSGRVVFRPFSPTQPFRFQVLLAGSDTPPRTNDALVGQGPPFGFFYLASHAAGQPVRVFQPNGPVVLGDPGDAGRGGAPSRFSGASAVVDVAAEDLWALNESRLLALRRRAIVRSDLEALHAAAAPGGPEAIAEGGPRPSPGDGGARIDLAVSQRVYTPLRAALDDLVRGAVILLALTIPFAFALERLLVGAATIQGRVMGFVVLFLATFIWLYLLHPGFAVAATPVIIFLAFAILLLSSLVIYLLLRKFQTELREIQGQAVLAHRQQASHLATLVAAVQMGMSTMRRRPTRTLLTTLTVVVLTFTMLCFAGFDRQLGVRARALGPMSTAAPADGLLLRAVDYRVLPPALRDLAEAPLRRVASGPQDAVGTDDRGEVVGAYWMTGLGISVARVDDGTAVTVRAVVGYAPGMVRRWPALAEALGTGSAQTKAAELSGDGVFLPPGLATRLRLQVGDPLLIDGHRVRLAGVLDPDRMTRLRHLDDRSVLPVDFFDLAASSTRGTSAAGGTEAPVEFQYLSATRVVVAGGAVTRKLGGELFTLTVFPAGGEPATLADELARAATVPVWSVGSFGLERRVLTTITRVTGLGAVAVPLALGGLIVFGTLLGSITDRQKEIYTFSALGLGPGHIGALFFAEAAVYAVVGGLGGQMLAQLVSFVFNALADRGLAAPLGINYASSNALFAMAVVMLTVLVSAIYPARKASRSANPGVARTWKIPAPQGDDLRLRFPFTVSAHDMAGVVAFLAEHFRVHDDAGLGRFAASDVRVGRDEGARLVLGSRIAPAPFDLGVTQRITLTATPSAIPGVDEVQVHIRRLSGTRGDWTRTNRVFLRDLRRQFLLWRTLDAGQVERYRRVTLEALGPAPLEARPAADAPGGVGVARPA